MKIIENNFKSKKDHKPEVHTCRWCRSKFEYDRSDIRRGNIVYSQREEDRNIEGLICPCCDQFDNLNNGY